LILSELRKKLKLNGVKSLIIINAPPSYSHSLQLSDDVELVETLQKKSDQIHLFVRSQKELERNLIKAEKVIAQKGMLWICYPKKSSGIKTDLDRDSGWAILSNSKLRQVAFISIDETWTAFGLRNEPKIREVKTEAALNKYIDKERRIVNAPEDLEKLFMRNQTAKQNFVKLSFSNKKEFVVWITEAKRKETRKERLVKTIQKLAEGKKNPTER
jgi:hypothetical protein